MSEQVLQGQEIAIRMLQDGAEVPEIRFVTTFDDEVKREIKEFGVLGEPFNRFVEVQNGYGGSLEFQVNNAGWMVYDKAIQSRAERANPGLRFDVVRIDRFSDGSSNLLVYEDVAWGPMTTSVAGRTEFVKVKTSFSCSTRNVQQDAFA